jgi:hypothetical protein
MKKKISFLAFVLLVSVTGGLSFGQTMTIVSPNGGETWNLESTQVISWTYTGMPDGTRVKLLLFLNGSPGGTIAPDLPVGQKTYSWNVGALQGGGQAAAADGYKVRIKAVSQTWFDQTNGKFKIAAAAKGPVIMVPRHPDTPAPLLFKPKLAVTAISLNVNASGYAIIFGYKNVGSGSLPPRHELPVKPDYKVIIDGRQIDAGDLWIPENPPGVPGYEQPTNSGGFIPFPGPGVPLGWTIGNQITITLDERNVLGQGVASKTSSLRLIALPVGYDLAFGPVTFDWSRNMITAVVTKVGGTPWVSKSFPVSIFAQGYHPADNLHADPGEATVTTPEGPFTILLDRAAVIPATGPFPFRVEKGLGGPYSLFYDLTIRVIPYQRDEIDESNNTVRIRFTRPSVHQGPVIDSLKVLEMQDSAGKPMLVPTILVNNKTPNPYTALRLVLKRNSSTMREWAIPTLASGASRKFEASEPRPGGDFRIIYEAYLYGGGGSILDAKTLDYIR